jgi:hypothetical protein
MTTYRITPVKHWSSAWAWWAARSFEWGGVTPDFRIAKADHYSMSAGERLCCWATAADTDVWYDFDNVTIGVSDLEFSMNAPFPAGLIYIAALPMYPFSRIQRKINQWGTSQWVGQTASTTNFIISNATPRTVGDGSGRTAPALPFYGLKIVGDLVGNKNKAILSAYNHPSETPGAFQLEGAVDYLLADNVYAETLRDWFEFYVYPCLNPQGLWSGWFRSSPQNATLDNNRQWATTGTLENIDIMKTAFATDLGGSIDVGIDYHSWMSSTDIFTTHEAGDTTGNYAYFNTEMVALDAADNLQESALDTSLKYLYKNTYSGSLCIGRECGGTLNRSVANHKLTGANSMRALYEMLLDGRFTYGP